jgi:hypothetical protein
VITRAMGPMIRELYANRILGFRGTEFMLGWRSVHLLQYWDSYEQLGLCSWWATFGRLCSLHF